jgi:hypothetical protein
LFTWSELEGVLVAHQRFDTLRDTKPHTHSHLDPTNLALAAASAATSSAPSEEADASDAVHEDAAAVAGAAGAAEEDRTQTDHLNKQLLQAFLRHINTTRPEGAMEGEVNEEGAAAFDDYNDDADGEEDEEEEEDEADLLDAVELRLQREPTQLQASAFATSAFPRDVVEIAGAGSVSDMIAAMQHAQKGGESSDDDEEGEGDDGTR